MIRLLIADDHPIVREGLKRILEELKDIQVVAEASTGDEVLVKLGAEPIDVALLDVSMPGPGIFAILERIGVEYPKVRVLVLSMQPEEMYAIRVLKAGASGYLTKDHSPSELAGAIRRIHQGGRYVSQALAEALAMGLDAGADRPPHEALSNREYQVLALLGSGKSIKEIAAQLQVSSKTASTYRSRILDKMGLETTADLIRYAVENKLEL